MRTLFGLMTTGDRRARLSRVTFPIPGRVVVVNAVGLYDSRPAFVARKLGGEKLSIALTGEI